MMFVYGLGAGLLLAYIIVRITDKMEQREWDKLSAQRPVTLRRTLS